MKHKDFRELLARAEAGEAQAQYDLGLLCRSAETEVPDYAGAVSWFRLAALQGHALAQYELTSTKSTRCCQGRGSQAPRAAPGAHQGSVSQPVPLESRGERVERADER
jgi:TPR repeat protein